jgi:hypothetical protein
MAPVTLKGHGVRTTLLFWRSLRNVGQCETSENIVATMPRTRSATPNRIAFSCSRTDSGVAALSRRVRKKPTVPKPKVAKVSVVRIQARVVRSSASWVQNFAKVVLSLAVTPPAAPGVKWFMVLFSLCCCSLGLSSPVRSRFHWSFCRRARCNCRDVVSLILFLTCPEKYRNEKSPRRRKPRWAPWLKSTSVFAVMLAFCLLFAPTSTGRNCAPLRVCINDSPNGKNSPRVLAGCALYHE